MFYEITYETGRTSVASYKDDDEAQAALSAHHGRAVRGESGGPLGGPAERIKIVRKYDKHPNEYNPDQTMSADVLKKELDALVDKMKDENGVVAIDRFAVEARAISNATVTEIEGPFDSIFKMKEKGELNLGFLKEVEG